MPIIEIVSDDLPLSQGDVLRDVRLFSTRNCWDSSGGSAAEKKSRFCLVVSRPCVAKHKEHVTIVSIDKYPSNPPKDLKTLDDVLRFLEDTRDGKDAPDIFYLGEIPGESGRFAARLDSFHNVQVPTDTNDRQAFVAARRIGRLNVEFARDLHLRLFRAFASLGFDDVRWLSDNDLKWIVDKGRAELAEKERDLSEKRASERAKEFQDKELSKQERIERDGAEERLHDFKKRLQIFIDELISRESYT